MSVPAHTLRWSPLVQALAAGIMAAATRPKLLAISGAQGSGKTTLTRLLTAELVRHGVRAVSCSLDDFYLTHAQRAELAQRVHPLLITRGVPGTHDVALCRTTLTRIAHEAVRLPVFAKGLDDRCAESAWPLAGPADLIVLEGWCLGARPQGAAALVAPINALERDEDPDGRWRAFVNAALDGPYRTLFGGFDALIYLRVPDFDAVRRWRGEQELQLPPAQRMNPAALLRFISHYERLTRWMLHDVPDRAHVTVALDSDHRIDDTVTNRPF
jgi:D-glycerate 3-kinase